jgi:hypothetical protein
VHTQTSCHTHELLGCDCQDNLDKELSSSSADDKEGSPDLSSDSDDETTGFVVATQVKQKTERKVKPHL